MRVIGTAGHVDHGKSALVAALTGTHPDRLKEEKEREMTIELGFAWFDIPGGESIGIIDVPGHRDFIENMLAGVGGIDAVLFVIAADEGVMPQTREHLAIIDLLEIPSGIIVLNKIDLISDPEWLDMVEDDLCQLAKGTVLENAPIQRVSSRTGEGIENLKLVLAECLKKQPVRPDFGRARLAVDRVFSITGFGTVATGTLLDGSFKLSDEIEVLPSGIRGRVRGLQTHNKKEQNVMAGSRVAVNLSGLESCQINRGDVLVHPGDYQPTRRLDATIHLLSDSKTSLKHSDEVKFFIGAMETSVRVRLLGIEELKQGAEGFLQIELEHPAVTVRGDRFIIRRPSPAETIGGGKVLNPHPQRRHRRFDLHVLDQLKTLSEGSHGELILQAVNIAGTANPAEIEIMVGLSSTDFRNAFKTLVESEELVFLNLLEYQDSLTGNIATKDWIRKITNNAVMEINRYQSAYPLRRGMPREELKSKLKLEQGVFQSLIRMWIDQEKLIEQIGLIRTPQFTIKLNPDQLDKVNKLLSLFRTTPFSPPTVKDSQTLLGNDLYLALLDQDQLIQVSPEVVFDPDTYYKMKSWTLSFFERESFLTVAIFRDHFSTSRKYALAFLEHLDAVGVTKRKEDGRVKIA